MEEQLKAKTKVHKVSKKKHEEARQEKYRNEMGEAEFLEEERRGKKVKELKKWLKMKEEQVRARKEKEDAVITEVLQKETAKAEAKKVLESKGQEERERRLKAGERQRAQVQELLLFQRAQRAGQQASSPSKHSQPQADTILPGGYPPQVVHPTMIAPAHGSPPQQRVVHRHIHHHVHYHEGDDENEMPPEGMVAPGKVLPNVNNEEQRQIEMNSEARVRSQLESSGQVPLGSGQSQHFHQHLGMPVGTLPVDPCVGTPTSMRQASSIGAVAPDDQERTQEAFNHNPAQVAPSMSTELQAQGKKRGLKKYAGNVDRAFGSYADSGRPKLVRPM